MGEFKNQIILYQYDDSIMASLFDVNNVEKTFPVTPEMTVADIEAKALQMLPTYQIKQQETEAKLQAEVKAKKEVQANLDTTRVERDAAKAEVVAKRILLAQLIIKAELSDDEYAAILGEFDVWNGDGTHYAVNYPVVHNGKLWFALIEHDSQPDWEPGVAPSLWTTGEPEGVVADWVQPTGAHDAYNTGDKVRFGGQVYRSLIDGNAHSPEEAPETWELVS